MDERTAWPTCEAAPASWSETGSATPPHARMKAARQIGCPKGLGSPKQRTPKRISALIVKPRAGAAGGVGLLLDLRSSAPEGANGKAGEAAVFVQSWIGRGARRGGRPRPPAWTTTLDRCASIGSAAARSATFRTAPTRWVNPPGDTHSAGACDAATGSDGSGATRRTHYALRITHYTIAGAGGRANDGRLIHRPGRCSAYCCLDASVWQQHGFCWCEWALGGGRSGNSVLAPRVHTPARVRG